MQLKCKWQKKKLGRMLKCGVEAHTWQHFSVNEPFTWKLVNEPDNPYDTGACYLALNGSNVGYVSRRQNSVLNETTCDIQRVECRVSGGQISFTVLVKMKKKFEKNEEDCDSASHVCKRQRA